MLLKLKKHFGRYVFSKQIPKLILKLIKGGDLPKESMLEVYRSDVFTQLRKKLIDIYPVTMGFLNEKRLQVLTKDYIKQFIATASEECIFGESFTEFLFSHKHMFKEGFIIDVAKLERLIYEANNAVEDYPLLLCMLENMHEVEWEFELRDSVKIFSSPYPIDKIYYQKVHSNVAINNNENMKTESEETYILVIRNKYEVETYLLSAIEYHFIRLFMKKVALDMIIIALLEKFEVTESIVTQVLEKLLSRGIFKLK